MRDDSIPLQSRPPANPAAGHPTPAEIRAERRRITESIAAHRALLAKRKGFEVADQRRLNREARERARVEQRYGKNLQRIHERRVRKERSLTRQLNGLDGKQESRERQALVVLRRESIERSLRNTYLSAGEVNGIGSGLVRALAARGIRTAADFRRVSWGKASNGRGGWVLYIHRARGGKVHINGIGGHRGRPLVEWRRQAVARAEARAPRELPPDERHRIAEIIENERSRLRNDLDELSRVAETERAEVVQVRAEAVARLAAARREAALGADERRAEFDAMAERLPVLQGELAAHIDRHGRLGRRGRWAQSRALRPLPTVPVSRAPHEPEHGSSRPKADLTKATAADGPSRTPGVRAGLGWLVPIVCLGLTAVLGVGEVDATAPLWFRAATRLVALATVAELLRLWVPRRRWRTAGPMPPGTGLLTSGVFLALVAASVFADPVYADGGAPWVLSAGSLLCLGGGAAVRAGKRKPGPVSG